MAFCPKCGKESNGGQFCTGCGYQFPAGNAAPQQGYPQQGYPQQGYQQQGYQQQGYQQGYPGDMYGYNQSKPKMDRKKLYIIIGCGVVAVAGIVVLILWLTGVFGGDSLEKSIKGTWTVSGRDETITFDGNNTAQSTSNGYTQTMTYEIKDDKLIVDGVTYDCTINGDTMKLTTTQSGISATITLLRQDSGSSMPSLEVSIKGTWKVTEMNYGSYSLSTSDMDTTITFDGNNTARSISYGSERTMTYEIKDGKLIMDGETYDCTIINGNTMQLTITQSGQSVTITMKKQ